MPAERAYVPNMPLMRAEQLLQTNIPNKRTELVRGVLIVRELHGARHGMVVANLCGEIGTHVHAHQLGNVGDSVLSAFACPLAAIL
jgi:2-keto-3-deoxy-galactonokinase